MLSKSENKSLNFKVPVELYDRLVKEAICSEYFNSKDAKKISKTATRRKVQSYLQHTRSAVFLMLNLL